MKKTKFYGFTLVELIIVITILAILSTIGFISFQGYSKNARDSNRLSTMSTIQKGISLNQATTSKTILPDDYTEVSASGNLMGYEGIVGENVGRVIGLNSIPKDPKTSENYIYYTNKDRNKVQIMGFLEGEEMVYLGINKAQASETLTKIPKVVGDNLGIILNQNNDRVTGEEIDILLGNSSDIYNVYFSNADIVNSSGSELFSKIYNRRTDLLNDKSLASFDDSLILYFDMETLSGGMLKDLSKYGNDGICYNSGTQVNCGINGQGPQFVSGDGKRGKAMFFDGIDDYIQILNKSYFYGNGKTIYVRVNPLTSTITNSSNMGYIIGNDWGMFQGGGGFGVRYLGNGQIQGVIWDISSTWLGLSTGNFLPNNYSSALFILNGSGSKIINNGSTILGNLSYSSYNNNKNLIIGSDSYETLSRTFNGIIDEVRIYNRALTDSEIQNLYNSTK